MSGYHFYAATLGWLMGVVFGTSDVVSYLETPLFFIFSGIFLFLLAYFVKGLRMSALFLSGMCILGFLHASTTITKFDIIARSTDAVERQAVVVNVTESNGRSRVLLRDMQWQVHIRASITENIPEVGDVIIYSALLQEPEAFMTETGRLFAYQEFSRARDVVFDAKKITYEHVGTSLRYRTMKKLYDFRDDIAATLARTVREPEAGFAQAMLLGKREALGEAESRVFREVGLVHIVVLSGLHVMAIFGAVILIASMFLPYRTRFVVALGSTTLFALMVGMSPSISRALIMATCLTAALLLGRHRAPVRALALAACIITFLSPYALLYDAGFQFSFLATFGVVVIASILLLFLRAVPETFGLRSIVAATLSVELALTPLLSWTIGVVPTVSILVNVLALPAVPLAMLSSLFLWFGSLTIPASVPFLAQVVTVLHGYILAVAHTMHILPHSYIVIASYSLSWLSVVYVCVGLALAWSAYSRAGMPRKQKSALSGPDVSHYTIETIDDIRARLNASQQRPN